MIDGGVMPRVTYIEHDGTRHRVEVPVGLSLMRGAIDNHVPGIDADCGGQCACATCHVYVEPAWFDKVGAPIIGSQEESMLSFAAVAEFNSRLACQIAMREEFDGLTVRMPQGQH
jgi:2Fe-2S ferredoxin